jgi:hypothetical protein
MYKKSSKIVLFAFLFMSFLSCRNFLFDKGYYEKISGIKFPRKYDIIETQDNGEFVTITSMRIDSMDLVAMIKTYNFDTLKMGDAMLPRGQNLLHDVKPDNQSVSHQFIFNKTMNKNDCSYLIDLNRKILWAEIGYPDWGGH